jgi:hypothetical protein
MHDRAYLVSRKRDIESVEFKSPTRHLIPVINVALPAGANLAHPCDMKQSTPNSSNQQSITPKFVGVDQAEAMSGLSRWTWRRWAYEGKIASVKAGKRLLIPMAEFDRVMSEGYRPAIPDEQTAHQ